MITLLSVQQFLCKLHIWIPFCNKSYDMFNEYSLETGHIDIIFIFFHRHDTCLLKWATPFHFTGHDKCHSEDTALLHDIPNKLILLDESKLSLPLWPILANN